MPLQTCFYRCFAAALGLLTLAAHAQPVRFTDITRQAGITFVHTNGATGRKYLPEMLGPGCAFLDYDRDGFPDIVLVNGTHWPDAKSPRKATLKLYRNNGNGTFRDVTASAGLAVSMYGMGAAAGDYDNDGDDDLFVSALGQSRLFRNNGDRTFSDVTAQSGMSGGGTFGTSAAWVDYDRDGRIDLVVANYVQWTPQTDLFCTLDGAKKSYCTPESYKGTSPTLWHNEGNGKFRDVTRKAGLYDTASKGLGVAILDANGDRWPDIVIANDTQPNKLYVSRRNGTFQEQGLSAGIAFNEDGVARAGMGIDAADYDRSGRASVAITNFSNEMIALYHNEGNGLFIDEAPRTPVGRASLLTLGFACFFFDYDLDGWLDLFVANGHIDADVERVQNRVRYRQPPHLFRNAGGGRFQEAAAGPDLAVPRVARGAAHADIDNDGDLDLLLTTNGGPAVLLRNDGGSRAHALRVRLRGTRSNRDGLGAVVRVDGQWQMLRSGSSYLSQSDLPLTFGLGTQKSAASVIVEWPSGHRDVMKNVAADREITIEEGKGIVATRAFRITAR